MKTGSIFQNTLKGCSPLALALLCVLAQAEPRVHENWMPNLTWLEDGVNGFSFVKNGKHLAIYRGTDTPSPDQILLTHHRRDVVSPALPHINKGSKAVVPEQERTWFETPEQFWKDFLKGRFHDYSQGTTRILTQGIPIHQSVKDGDTLDWEGMHFQVLSTPGYTPGSVSYQTEWSGKKLIFTGDLIYGDGQVLDLYSFQNEIPEVKLRGYHGFGGRFPAWLQSLERLKALKPDYLLPARGPVISNPIHAIKALQKRIRDIYRNYLSINALYWYFKKPHMQRCAELILGDDPDFSVMEYSHHEAAPDWMMVRGTTRLIISDDGYGFLLDCGYQDIISFLEGLMEQKVIRGIDGIYVTHYHDDHADQVQAAAERFGCPVWATEELVDVLENPGAYHLPALTANPIHQVHGLADGTTWKWREYTLTSRFYPGQTLYHGALRVQRPEGDSVFFIGDALTPSGIDDYCLLNRNLLHENGGYLRCFQVIREEGPSGFLMNQHVGDIFRYSESELLHLETTYRKRIELLKDLFPWDDPNYGVDEQWARFYPYGMELPSGQWGKASLQIWNHSPHDRRFLLTPNLPKGWTAQPDSVEITLKSLEEKGVEFAFKSPSAWTSPAEIITANIHSEGMKFDSWCEMIVLNPDLK